MLSGLLLLCVSVSLWLLASAQAEDWSFWRGPEQTGVSREKDMPEKWSLKPGPDSNLIWRKPHGGRSAPLVMNGRVYIINKAGEEIDEQERVMCFDAKTGKVEWQYRFNVFYSDIVSARVGWSNLAGDPETGNVYAHGVQGLLYCFDRNGKVLWSHSTTEEYGRISGYGGRVNSPIVDGDLVIIGMVNANWGDQARGGNRYLALDKRTGEPVWWATTPGDIRGTYYSVPVVTVIGGQRLMITGGSGGGVHAFKVRTGEHVWSYQVGAKAINSSPVVQGTRVYIGYGEELIGSTVQGRVVCLDAAVVKNKQPKLVWKVDGITDKFSSPLIYKDRLYVCNEGGTMFCLNAKDGNKVWEFKYGTSGAGSPVWADGKIYIAEAGPTFSILKDEGDHCKQLFKFRFRSPDGMTAVEINGSPAVANGRLYFTTSEEILCIGKKDHKAKAGPVPPQPKEDKVSADPKPAHLQVLPADVVLSPGESTHFKVRAFNGHGQFLREVKAEWSLPTPPRPPNAKASPPPLKGDITTEGVLRVSQALPSQHGYVEARVGKLAGRARVRVVPHFPYKQDFSKVPLGATPGAWINCQGKYVVVEKGGGRALKKLNTSPNPLLARSRTFFGPATMKNYTIQADMLGTLKNDNLPDMGLSSTRYTLMLDGNKQQLRLTSWAALPRVDRKVDFAWKPDVWYRMKFTVEVKNGKGLLRGKVWPRDKGEPDKWTIEFTDPTPNPEGSPALYAYATGVLDDVPGSEVFFTNVSVALNKK
jgi:outer membrane protein assembly factor BamB